MYTFATFFPGFGLMIQRSRASIWLRLKEFPPITCASSGSCQRTSLSRFSSLTW